jgi:uncharacterized protein (TIGR00255 family)
VLLSMTGFGDARGENERLSVAVEVRSVNNRYLKVVSKLPDSLSPLESEIEKLVRGTIARGTVNVAFRIDRLEGGGDFGLDREVLAGYWRQLCDAAAAARTAPPSDVSALLALPGVVVEQSVGSGDREQDLPLVQAVLGEALGKLDEFRRTEGQSMAEELRANARLIAGQLDLVAAQAPQVVSQYRDRLCERVKELLNGSEAMVTPADLIREVSIFAERCDINEEITRMRSHLAQFEEFLNAATSMGRKLEFLTQEMFREVNTIGSKANDVSIAHCVVEMKSAIEKIREILQNVE